MSHLSSNSDSELLRPLMPAKKHKKKPSRAAIAAKAAELNIEDDVQVNHAKEKSDASDAPSIAVSSATLLMLSIS